MKMIMRGRSPQRMSLVELQARAFFRANTHKTVVVHKKAKTPSKIKKSVRFGNATTVAVRPSLTEEETSRLWYKKPDYVDMDRARRETIYALNQANGNVTALDPNEHCLTGLEETLSMKQVLSKRLRALHYNRLILEQQHLERTTSCCSSQQHHHQELSAISQMFSRQASKRAQLRAVLSSSYL